MTPGAAGRLGSSRGRLILFFAIGTAFGAFIIAGQLLKAEVPPPGSTEGSYTYPFTPPKSAYEVVMNKGDGQAYTLLAQDPSLSHPEVFYEGRFAAAYFSQKPLLVYLLWALSFGQASWVPVVFTILCPLMVGFYCAACALLADARHGGESNRFAIVAILLPGAIIAGIYGPYLLAVGLAFAGVVLFSTERRNEMLLGAVCFVLAALARETMLLFPIAAGLLFLYRRKLTWRRAALLAAAPVVLFGWYQVVRWRFGPAEGQSQYIFAPPFTGLIKSIPEWGVAEIVNFGLLVACLVIMVVRFRRDELMWYAAAFAIFSIVLARGVWVTWNVFPRVLLPLYLLPILGVLGDRLGDRPNRWAWTTDADHGSGASPGGAERG